MSHSEEKGRPRIVILAGGTASRNLTIALVRRGLAVTRIVPAWDSGGSSRVIREALAMLSVGDIRHALMTMAYAEGHAGDVVRIFNARLSESGTDEELKRELGFYASGIHPVLKAMDPEVSRAIVAYLETFIAAVGPGFDFRRGSIGNFVLAGACLAHDRDVNAAILEFKKLCGIAGEVWPVSISNDIGLVSTLRDGKRVEGQHRITALDDEDARTGIDCIALTADAPANPRAIGAIAMADAIVYGPGSFFTSVLAHLLVDGVAETIARASAAKILVGNMLEDRETRGLTLNEMARRVKDRGGNLLTHILANQGVLPFERTVGAARFVRSVLPFDEERDGVQVIARDFEDPWHRGAHDSGMLSSIIADLARPPRPA